MRTRSLVLSVVLGAVIAIGLTVGLRVQVVSVEAQPAAVDHSDEISKALGYISAQQNEDGGIPWFTADSDAGVTASLLRGCFPNNGKGFAPEEYHRCG